jgi:thermostable 8-oxoguanine DNA glycosylase
LEIFHDLGLTEKFRKSSATYEIAGKLNGRSYSIENNGVFSQMKGIAARRAHSYLRDVQFFDLAIER